MIKKDSLPTIQNNKVESKRDFSFATQTQNDNGKTNQNNNSFTHHNADSTCHTELSPCHTERSEVSHKQNKISYKQSGIEWLGEIPTHWEVKRLRFVGHLYGGITGKTFKDFSKEYQPNFKPYITFTNVCNNTAIDPNKMEYVFIDTNEKQNKVTKGDILFLQSSETPEDVGKSAVYLSDKEVYLNSFCKGFRVQKTTDSVFLNYFLSSKNCKKYFMSVCSGFTRINLRQEHFLDIPLLLPPLKEQQEIAKFLDKKCGQIEHFIIHKQKLISLLTEQKQALINEVVTKGLSKINTICNNTDSTCNNADSTYNNVNFPCHVVNSTCHTERSEVSNNIESKNKDSKIESTNNDFTIKSKNKESNNTKCRFFANAQNDNEATIQNDNEKINQNNKTNIIQNDKTATCNNIDSIYNNADSTCNNADSTYNNVNFPCHVVNSTCHTERSEVSYKQSGIEWLGEIPTHWEVIRFKFLAKVCNGKEQSSVCDESGQYPIYGSGGIIGRANNYIYDKTSVLLGRKGTIDKPLFVEKPFWVIDTMFFTKIFKTTNPKYFFYLCLNIDFARYTSGSAIPSMTQSDLENIVFAIPPLKEQQEIAKFLDKKITAIDRLIKITKEQINLIKEYKTSLINECICGRIRLN